MMSSHEEASERSLTTNADEPNRTETLVTETREQRFTHNTKPTSSFTAYPSNSSDRLALPDLHLHHGHVVQLHLSAGRQRERPLLSQR